MIAQSKITEEQKTIDAKLSPRGMRERMECQRLITRDLLENLPTLCVGMGRGEATGQRENQSQK